MLKQLIYSSILNTSVDWKDIVEISKSSQSRNKENELSGILVLYQNQVLQLLEGESLSITQVFNNILNDKRHTQVNLLNCETIPDRRFGAWKLKEVNIDRLDGQFKKILEAFMVKENTSLRLPQDSAQAYALLASVYAANKM